MDALADVAAELLAMVDRDQRMRRDMIERGAPWDPSVDAEHLARLRAIVDRCGWPTISRVGKEAEDAAWLLVQHAPDGAFQERCLELMRGAGESEVCARHLAYLEDRINVRKGRPQRFGTQLRQGTDGKWEPSPLAEPERVDDLRASVQLEPLRAYVERFQRSKAGAPPRR